MMRTLSIAAGGLLALVPLSTAAEPDARNNLVRPIHGPGPVRPEAPRPSPPPAPAPPPSPSAPAVSRPQREPVPIFRRQFSGNRSSYTVGRTAGTLARPIVESPDATLDFRTDARPTAPWGVTYSDAFTDPWWRGDRYTSRPQWDLGNADRYRSPSWWTFPGTNQVGVPDRLDDGYGFEVERPLNRLDGPAGRRLLYVPIDPAAPVRTGGIGAPDDFRVPGPSPRERRRSSATLANPNWTEPPQPRAGGLIAAKPRRDIRPDIRRAINLSDDRRYSDAVDTMRRAVIEEPEAFTAIHGEMFARDADAARISDLIALYQRDEVRPLAPADQAFMVAALSAVRGDRPAAAAAVRALRDANDDRPSSRTLHRVLTRTSPPASPPESAP